MSTVLQSTTSSAQMAVSRPMAAAWDTAECLSAWPTETASRSAASFFRSSLRAVGWQSNRNNGYLMTTIAGDILTVEYRDIEDIRLFVEEFRPGGVGGSLAYRIVDRGTILTPP